MHKDREIQFDHALYDLQGHYSGAQLGDDEKTKQAIVDLVDGADMALYRNEGYFFDAIDDRIFVFGRLVEWDTVRSGECFFDLYATPLENIHNVSVKNLVNEILDQSQHISEKDQSIESSVSITVRAEQDTMQSPLNESNGDPSGPDQSEKSQSTQSAAHESISDADATDRALGHGERDDQESIGEETPDATANNTTHEKATGSKGRSNETTKDLTKSETGRDNSKATDEETNISDTETEIELSDSDIKFIAQFWEHYRRGTEPVGGPIDVVDRMTRLVDGTLANIRFVSRVHDKGDPYHFDIVGGGIDDPHDVTGLVDTIRKNAENGTLSWEDLPTYEEELNELVDTHYKSLLPTFEATANKDTFTTFRSHFEEDQVSPVFMSRLDFYHEVWEIFIDDYWETLTAFEEVVQKQAAETFADAADPNAQLVVESKEEDNRFIDKVSGLVRGGDNRDAKTELRKDLDVSHVDDEEVQAVIHQLVEVALENALERLDGPLSDDLRSGLKKRTEQVALDVIHRLEKIRDSRAYREVHRG